MSNNPLVKARLRRYFDEYAKTHQTKKNQLLHHLGVPLITLSVLGFFSQFVLLHGPMPESLIRLDAAVLLMVLVELFYLFLDWKIAIPAGLFVTGLYWLSRAASPSLLLFFFILGWALQLWGHAHFEKKRPAFLSNAIQLLIGPLWIFSKWVGYSE